MRNAKFLKIVKNALLVIALSLASNNMAKCEDLSVIKNAVVSRINLINEIINVPKAANMKNWGILGNPHDERELKFYMNSISDGTTFAYDRKEKSMRKLIEHSQSVSEDEPSILLQYLRLSIMAFNTRPGVIPPYFQLIKLSQPIQHEIVARCIYEFVDNSGVTVKKKAEIIFDIGDNPRRDLFLQKITIGERLIYGGW